VAAHTNGEIGVRHRVHRGRKKWNFQAEATELHRHLDLGRISRDGAGHQRHLLEAVGASQPALDRIPDGRLLDQRPPPRI
jgi:hypothetical protein